MADAGLADVATLLAVNPVPWARAQMAFTLAVHIVLVPLGKAPMDPALAKELEQWQALAAESWERFPYEEVDA